MPILKTLVAVGVLTALGYLGNVASLPVAFSVGVQALDFQSTAIIFLKQFINGIINALIAAILISLLPWQKWFRPPAGRPTIAYSQIIFQLTSAFLMLTPVGNAAFYQLPNVENNSGRSRRVACC